MGPQDGGFKLSQYMRNIQEARNNASDAQYENGHRPQNEGFMGYLANLVNSSPSDPYKQTVRGPYYGISSVMTAPAEPPPPSPVQEPAPTMMPTIALGPHERDRMQQDNTSDADAWWRKKENY